MTFQVGDFLYEIFIDEEAEMTEKFGLVEGRDLITLRERLRRHGVET